MLTMLIYVTVVIRNTTVQADSQRTAVAEQDQLLQQQEQLILRRRLLAEARQAFSEHQSWLYDLQVSWLTESETAADAAREHLQKLLPELQQHAPNVANTLGKDFAAFSKNMLEAVDAYVDNNRVLGNSLVAEARQRAVRINGEFETALNEVSSAIDGIAGQLAEAGSGVRDSAEMVYAQNHDLQIVAIFSLIFTVLALGGLCWALITAISKPMQVFQSTIEAIERESDLRKRMTVTTGDEIGHTADAINKMLSRFESIIVEVQSATNRLTTSTRETTQRMTVTGQDIDRQQHETDQVSSAITELSHSVQSVAESATQAATAARLANNSAHQGQAVVNSSELSIQDVAKELRVAGESIHRVASDTENIDRVLEVIRGVSEQTNLLALNAAIEAARAGEAGRGFAVVADEVRVLAQRTRDSTQEIQAMIERLQSGGRTAVNEMEHGVHQAESAVEQASNTRHAFEDIIHAVQSINDLNTQIASAAEQQAHVTASIERNAVNIHDATAKAVDAAHQTIQSCEQLLELAQHLQKVVGQFKAGQ